MWLYPLELQGIMEDLSHIPNNMSMSNTNMASTPSTTSTTSTTSTSAVTSASTSSSTSPTSTSTSTSTVPILHHPSPLDRPSDALSSLPPVSLFPSFQRDRHEHLIWAERVVDMRECDAGEQSKGVMTLAYWPAWVVHDNGEGVQFQYIEENGKTEKIHYLTISHVFDFIPNYHALWTQTTAHTFVAAVVSAFQLTNWYQQHKNDTHTPSIHVGMNVTLRSSDYLHPKLHTYAHTMANVTEVTSTWYRVKLHDGKMVYIQSGAVVGDGDASQTSESMSDISSSTGASRPTTFELSLPTLPEAGSPSSSLQTSTSSAFTPHSSLQSPRTSIQSPRALRARTSSSASEPESLPMLSLASSEPPLCMGQHVMIRSHPILLHGAAWLIGMDAIVTQVPTTPEGTYTVRLNHPQQQSASNMQRCWLSPIAPAHDISPRGLLQTNDMTYQDMKNERLAMETEFSENMNISQPPLLSPQHYSQQYPAPHSLQHQQQLATQQQEAYLMSLYGQQQQETTTDLIDYIGKRVRIIAGIKQGQEGVIGNVVGNTCAVRVGTQVITKSMNELELISPPPVRSQPRLPLQALSGQTLSSEAENNKKRPGLKHYIGRHVIIASGKYRGEMGVVTKGGNGYLTVQFLRQVEGLKASEGNCVMKRSSDLLPVTFPPQSGMEDSMMTPAGDDTMNRRISNNRPFIRRSQSLGDEKEFHALRTSTSSSSLPQPSTHALSAPSSPANHPKRHPARSRSRDLMSDDSSTDGDMDGTRTKRRRVRVEGPRGEKLVDHRVLIRGGKYRDSTGIIRASAHGFYTIELSDGKGNILKRLHDLDVYNLNGEILYRAETASSTPSEASQSPKSPMPQRTESTILPQHAMSYESHPYHGTFSNVTTPTQSQSQPSTPSSAFSTPYTTSSSASASTPSSPAIEGFSIHVDTC